MSLVNHRTQYDRVSKVPYKSTSGITNHDEYSLIYELMEDKDNMSTLKKGSTIARMERKKLEEMKKRLHTDDECKL